MFILKEDIRWTEITLVIPAIPVLGQDSGCAFAIQVQPLVYSAVQADVQVLQALRVHVEDRLLRACYELLGW